MAVSRLIKGKIGAIFYPATYPDTASVPDQQSVGWRSLHIEPVNSGYPCLLSLIEKQIYKRITKDGAADNMNIVLSLLNGTIFCAIIVLA